MSKIARFRIPGDRAESSRYGVLQNGTLAFIEGDILGSWHVTQRTIPLGMVQLLPPVNPPNVYAIGLNYRLHAQESNMPLPERPIIFIKSTNAVCGPTDKIILPRVAPDEVDYECELAIIIGKKAHHVSQEAAFDYVLGYTCSNDVSARDCQIRLDKQWARAKSFDTFAPMGPWIETEIDPDNAPIRTRLNGKVMQESNTNDMIFSCRELIAHLSDSFTLSPGTVIMTGTPSGVGFARKPPVFMRDGDVVEIEIDGIGCLRNEVRAER